MTDNASFRHPMHCIKVFPAIVLALAFALLPGRLHAEDTAEPPMQVPEAETANHRWLLKEVLGSRLLDDMESVERWRATTWNQGGGSVEQTADRAHDGQHSLRFQTATSGTHASADGGVFGATSALRVFEHEDWREFNRLSFWVYPDLPGFHAVALSVRLGNDGPRQGRDTHHFLMKNHSWNQIVWEFPDVARDRVTELAFTYVLNGHEPGAAETALFDIDQVELQTVRADHYEGWNVAPGHIAFSHTGYPTGGPKFALASDLEARIFQLIGDTNDKVAYEGPIQTTETPIGKYQVMDFTDYREPGTYRLHAGDRQTRAFRIDDHVWERTIWKTLNFFYAERCGCAIPGVHDACHQDWQGQWEDTRIPIHGGWHDAGDLSQGLVNTSEAVYAMFALAQRMGDTTRHAKLADRLIEEAQWGLDWVMKTSFHNGYRIPWATMRFWTNGKLGDHDDTIAKATRDPASNFYAAAAEALAYRVLKDRQPARAKQALAMAVEDWQFGAEMLAERDRNQLNVEQVSIAILASVELHHATGETRYGQLARSLGTFLIESQQQDWLPGLDVPMTGFFYRSPARRQPVTYMHRGHEQAPIIAMTELCRAFPDDSQWIDWYAAVALHSEYYQKAMARWTAPYCMLPNSLHRAEPTPPNGDARAKATWEQITSGFSVGNDHFVRVYPVQPDETFRGNYGTMLSQTKAVAAAATLRKQPELLDLCQKQLYWIVGLNPFVQSTMYGEGYDYAPQYTARSGDIVGSLPVGMKSLGNRDLPYWPATNVWNYKEVWVHPSSRWLWLMADLGVPDENAQPQDQLKLVPDAEPTPDGHVALRLEARGDGRHTFSLRTFNLDVDTPTQTIDLNEDKARVVQWTGKVRTANRPWVAVVVADNDVRRRVEFDAMMLIPLADRLPANQ